jgi:two-component system chemotaxis response regulator CheB
MLQRCSALKVREARQGERPQAGTVYVAPGGCHLEVDLAGHLSVKKRGRIAFVCPSADVLFHSVAARYGSRAVALVLSGDGSDGAAGSIDVRRAGGFVLAQDPRGCEHPGMPSKAIETRKVDLVLPLERLGFALNQIT